jgi:hypothetical protein
MANDQRRWMRGKVFPIQGCCCPRPGVHLPALPGTWRPTVRWDCQGGGAGQRSQGRGRGRGFTAWSPPPSCLVEYASVTAGRTPGVTDQDLRQSEAWLSKCRCLAGMIRYYLQGLGTLYVLCHGEYTCSHVTIRGLYRPRSTNSYLAFRNPKNLVISDDYQQKTSLKSGAFGSHHGESLYLLIVEVIKIILGDYQIGINGLDPI